jgi:hypothetical protein
MYILAYGLELVETMTPSAEVKVNDVNSHPTKGNTLKKPTKK